MNTTFYQLGNQDIMHVIFGKGDELKARRDSGTDKPFWVYWAEPNTWTETIPALVQAGKLTDKITGPYCHCTTYVTGL